MNGLEATIECKGQPIDPVRYPQNFVEVFEITSNPRHEGGLTRVAEILGVPVDDISEARVKNRGVRVGGPQCVSVSVTPTLRVSRHCLCERRRWRQASLLVRA